jgi:hypothetical protein
MPGANVIAIATMPERTEKTRSPALGFDLQKGLFDLNTNIATEIAEALHWRKPSMRQSDSFRIVQAFLELPI